MKKLSVFLFVFFINIFPSSAEIIWSADPNKSNKVTDFFKRLDDGNYPQDYCKVKGDEKGVAASTASIVTDPRYGKVWHINKPINRKRGEFARFEGKINHLSPKEGDDLYIAWNWKIDTADGTKIDKEITVFQWKSASPHNQNYPINMEYDGDLTLNVFGADYSKKVGQFKRRAILWRKAIPQGEWVSLIVRVKVNKDDFGGVVQFWFNGELQQLDNLKTKLYQAKISDDKKSVFHRTNDGRFVYPKWGAYNKKSCQYNVNIYYHDMKVGTTLESVMPIQNH
ncbi:hypothetical protein C2869_02570 [Saccharobesus litoralis]|uniref:Polysaccharide lyase n=1 Tax=Saccharobesus litoralis TaxID=2172099 RepID=A0A2S0VMR1_9ALTE|nr:heparin lyase I family protein [Saccharobesus litoralis]AWB65390.1 hypothetical protein C2869_02570 [Saccharobesus litoralis]